MTTDTTGTGTGGAISWNYSISASAADHLAQNEIKVEQFTITLNDGHGGTIDRTIAVTATGTNDAPVITSGDPQAGFETSGQTGSSTLDEAWGSLGFVDPDYADYHTVTFSAPTVTTTSTAPIPSATTAALATAFSASLNDSTGGGSGQINWYFGAADSKFDFLGFGQTLTATYTVTLRDNWNVAHTQTVSVTVTGIDHIPVFTGGAASAVITESSTASIANPAAVTHSRTGTLGFQDIDRGDTHIVQASLQEDGAVWSGVGASTLSQATLNAMTNAFAASLQSDSALTGSGTVAWSFGITDNYFDFMSAGPDPDAVLRCEGQGFPFSERCPDRRRHRQRRRQEHRLQYGRLQRRPCDDLCAKPGAVMSSSMTLTRRSRGMTAAHFVAVTRASIAIQRRRSSRRSTTRS